jgi:AbrB family looped-hinge helix DNA binding protein
MVSTMVDGMRVPIDKAGRIVLPKALRDRFRLRAGSRLDVEVHDDHVRLVPVSPGPALRRLEGWWVHQGTPDPGADLVEALERHRTARLGEFHR